MIGWRALPAIAGAAMIAMAADASAVTIYDLEFNAGIGSGMTLVAVNDVEYSKDALEDAIKTAKNDKAPIRIMVKEFDRYRTIPVDYHDGLRYPHLERIEGKTDYLTPIFTKK